MDDRAEQVFEGAAGQAVVPPHHFGLQRFQTRQGQPADHSGMDPIDRSGAKPA